MATITGTNGNDTITGTSDGDRIYPLLGRNIVNAGAGDDWIFSVGGSDLVDGGSGIDWWAGDYGSQTVARTLTWNAATGVGAFSNGGTLTGIEQLSLVCGSGADKVTINGNVVSWANIETGAGDDTITLRAGGLHVRGGSGTDRLTLDLAADPDGVTVELIDDGLGGLSGSYVGFGSNYGYVYEVEQVTIIGGGGADWIVGAGGADSFVGGAGKDTLIGGDGSDTLIGGAGVDSLEGGAGNDLYGLDSASDVTVELAGGGTDTIQSSISLSLGTAARANIENLTLIGTAAINATGSAGANVLTGNAAANSLNGGGGIDTLVGGDGDDTYTVDTATDVIIELQGCGTDTIRSSISLSLGTAARANIENLTLIGTAAINATGSAGANVLTGNAAANSLNGGGGIDTLVGGDGDDTYTVDTATDVIIELAGGGTDTVRSNVSFSLESLSEIENLTLTGAAAISGRGNDRANVLTGNTGNGVLYGLAGDDTLAGGDGSDTLFGDAGADSLVGGNGDDALAGGAGADTMRGMTGDDSYFVDDIGDVVEELAGEGTDAVSSSITYALGANFENLWLEGDAAINGTGNEFANYVAGNAGRNFLYGRDGDDTMTGGDGDDHVTGEDGNDVLFGESGNDNLIGWVGDDYLDGGDGDDLLIGDWGSDDTPWGGNDFLWGGAGDDDLSGGRGDDILHGGDGNDYVMGDAGADTMFGEAGDDFYHVDDAGDTVWEAAGAGTDWVYSRISYTLPENVETLWLEGGAIDGTGNSSSNQILGTAAANRISGGGGNDWLRGDGGADTLDGGLGADRFHYVSTSDSGVGGRDTIVAFDNVGSVAGDIIELWLIDADSSLGGDQAFTFIGTAGFSVGVAGQLRVLTSGSDTVIQGETNADGVADFEVLVQNTSAGAWTADDFWL